MKRFLLILSLALYVSAQVTGGYSLVDPEEVDSNPEIQKALTLGAHHVVEQGIQAGDLEDADYDVTGIYNVWSQVVSGMNYKFDVELTNSLGTVVRANYVVYIQSWTNTEKVISYDYTVEGPGEVGEGELGEFDFLPEEVYFSEEEAGLWEEEEPLAGGWSPVSRDQVSSDLDIQNALNFGIAQVTQKAAENGEIPPQSYQQEQLVSAEEQVVSGMNYRFVVDLRGDGGALVRTKFVVYSQPWTNTQELTSYEIESVN